MGQPLSQGLRMKLGQAMPRKGTQRIPGRIWQLPQNRVVEDPMFKEERRSRFHLS